MTTNLAKTGMTHRSAGAVVVSNDLARPVTLLLDQVRHDGERQTVAPKGTIEAGESPLLAARREVSEEAGISDLLYAGYLGQQRYAFTGKDGRLGVKTVDWFLFATDSTSVVPRIEEGFTSARWVSLDRAAGAVSHESFVSFLHRAAAVTAWRQRAPLPFSPALSDLMWQFASAASAILAGDPAAGIGVCGSAARGDFVAGWSDLDLIGWGITDRSAVAQKLADVIDQVQGHYGIRTSLRLAGTYAAGSQHDYKVRAVLGRSGIDLVAIAGDSLPPGSAAPGLADLAEYAAHTEALLAWIATSAEDRSNRARRTLSTLCSASRNIATHLAPGTSHRLTDVAALLDEMWPASSAVRLLRVYDRFRQVGADDLDAVEELAHATQGAIHELQTLVDTAPDG